MRSASAGQRPSIVSASEVLASGIGFCNTKSTLLIALLRAIGIPARVHCVTINRRILRGLIRPPAEFVDHSYTEVLLENRWLGIDSYIVDAPLHRAAVARCRAENLEIGYGVRTGRQLGWSHRRFAHRQ
jgi:transglutaminase-like putative cysteine protease